MSKRYKFDGFTFGDDDTLLEITILKESGYGYTTKFNIELTTKERKELIVWLKSVGKKEGN
jgi:hypothetical protein